MVRKFIGIDPGPEKSTVVSMVDEQVSSHAEMDRNTLLNFLEPFQAGNEPVRIGVEDFMPYGTSLGHESMATIKLIGVLEYNCSAEPIPRQEVKLHLCGTKRANDRDIRDALIHRFGPGREKAVGKKKTPGPLYGISNHGWAALAVAVMLHDRYSGGA